MRSRTRSPFEESGAPGTVGEPAGEVDSSTSTNGASGAGSRLDVTALGDPAGRFEEATRALNGATPLSMHEARALLDGPVLDAVALAADRAEALAQLNAALAGLATLLPRPPAPVLPPGAPDPEELRRIARAAVAANENLRRAEAVLASLATADEQKLRAARQALKDAVDARADVHPARRRTAGALISGAGMAIVIGTLGWPAWAYLVPSELVLIMAADLRVAHSSAKDATARAAEQVAAAGVVDAAGLEAAWARLPERDLAASRAEEARWLKVEAHRRWAELAPGEEPDDVETVIERILAAALPAEPAMPAATESTPEDPALRQARVLAESLIDEARADLARAEEGLRQVARCEHARRSLEWHEAQAALGT